MFPEPDIHENLDIEYERVVTSFEVLTLVESNFKDSFDAKGFLCDIFMVNIVVPCIVYLLTFHYLKGCL
jgi:hypothetical protein